MTADQFRRIALSFPQAVEGGHQGHPDFRVGNKVFATLGPDDSWGMIKLRPEQQLDFLELDAFNPANGAWGERGHTIVTLVETGVSEVERALRLAWANSAPKKLAQ